MLASLKQHDDITPNWLFDPTQGQIVREPLASGAGNWVGAPGLFSDANAVYLTYRYRQPRDQGRGIESRIARSVDGVHFADIWAVHQQELHTSSVERFAMDKTAQGYVLFISYVDPRDNRWRVDRVVADCPENFRVSEREPLFTASDVGLEAVKDPVIVHTDGLSWMFLSGAAVEKRSARVTQEQLHMSQDVYTTGLIKSITGVAISRDGIHYEWLGPVLMPSKSGWDAYASRISTVIGNKRGFVAFYDGSASEQENYEERTGVAVSADLIHWTKLSVSQPWLISPHSPGTLRYIDYVQFKETGYFYYEFVRRDGSHELRVNVV